MIVNAMSTCSDINAELCEYSFMQMVLRVNRRRRKKEDLLSSPHLLKTVLDPATTGVWILTIKIALKLKFIISVF